MRPSGNFQELFEWQLVDGVANLLHKTCNEMNLGRDEEWILEVIRESADQLPSAIIEGQQSEYLAEYILGISAARNSLVVAAYCVHFLRGQGLMEIEKADYIEGQLEELEAILGRATDQLRSNLVGDQWRFSNN